MNAEGTEGALRGARAASGADNRSRNCDAASDQLLEASGVGGRLERRSGRTARTGGETCGDDLRAGAPRGRTERSTERGFEGDIFGLPGRSALLRSDEIRSRTAETSGPFPRNREPRSRPTAASPHTSAATITAISDPAARPLLRKRRLPPSARLSSFGFWPIRPNMLISSFWRFTIRLLAISAKRMARQTAEMPRNPQETGFNEKHALPWNVAFSRHQGQTDDIAAPPEARRRLNPRRLPTLRRKTYTEALNPSATATATFRRRASRRPVLMGRWQYPIDILRHAT